MIDFGNHYCVAQIWALSLGTCCPPREQRLFVSCSPIPHHVIPEGPLGEHGRNFWSFPNQEVRQGFSESLCQYYTPSEVGELDAIVYAYKKNVLINDDMGAFMPHLKAFYDKFPYTIINNNERHYQAVMFTIFTMLGEDVKVEHTTSDGRIDLVLKTDKSIFIFELKYEKAADAAMAQISGKDYAKAFADDGRKVVKVAVNFSEDQRSIEDWVIE